MPSPMPKQTLERLELLGNRVNALRGKEMKGEANILMYEVKMTYVSIFRVPNIKGSYLVHLHDFYLS